MQGLNKDFKLDVLERINTTLTQLEPVIQQKTAQLEHAFKQKVEEKLKQFEQEVYRKLEQK